MFFDITVEIKKTKQFFVEADSEAEAIAKAEEIAEEKESDWDYEGDYLFDEVEIDEDDILEFPSLEEARAYYASGDDIPAYRICGRFIEEI